MSYGDLLGIFDSSPTESRFGPNKMGGGRGRRISEFEASLVYKVSSRTASSQDYTKKPRLEKKKEMVSLSLTLTHNTHTRSSSQLVARFYGK